MDKFKKPLVLLNDFKDLSEKYDEIISIAVIGSYNTDYWKRNISDIDILILLKSKRRVEFEFELEDDLLPQFREFFSYGDVHITFLYMNEFNTDFAEEYIKSNNKVIYDFEKEIDFRMYVNKYLRNSEWYHN